MWLAVESRGHVMDSPDRFGSADRPGSAVRSRPRDADLPAAGGEEPASACGALTSIADLPTARLPRISLPRHSGALRRVRRQRAARLLLQRKGRARTIVIVALCI